MKKTTTYAKHYLNLILKNSSTVIKNQKAIVISSTLVAITILVLFKVTNLSTTKTNQNQPKAVKAVEIKRIPNGESLFNLPLEIIPAVLRDTSLVNTFSNVGFILNPSYAKKHNISPAVVAAKRRICIDYIERYAKVAQEESKKFGIPTSITLAQALLESNAGASKLATENKNHFGIKCFSKTCASGHCTRYTDDSHKDFFRKYNSVWESYRAHSNFLKKPRYQTIFTLDSKDYKGWAKGLSEAGYATDPKYANKLIRIIEELRLYKYDV